MAHKYSVVLSTLVSGGGDVWAAPDEVLETIAEAGYDGVDFDADPDRIDPELFRRVTDRARGLGLRLPGLVGAWGVWHAGEERDLVSSDEDVRAYAVSYAKRSIDLASDFDEPPVFNIDAVPPRPEYPVSSIPHRVLRESFERSAREIAEYADPRRVQVAIEPINRFEGYVSFMNSVEDAMSVVRSLDMDNFGVMADLFHVNIEDGPVTDALRMAGDKLLYVHLADSNRQVPGTGHIDFLNVVRTLDEIGYTGYIATDTVPSLPDWKTVVTESIAFMKQIERTVALQHRLAASG